MREIREKAREIFGFSDSDYKVFFQSGGKPKINEEKKIDFYNECEKELKKELNLKPIKRDFDACIQEKILIVDIWLMMVGKKLTVGESQLAIIS